jgi:Fe-coproporphyrin III synthase
MLMRSPRSVDIDITSRCNLNCKYCYYFHNKAVSYHDISAKEWLQFFDELGKCAVMRICLAGGEPFIRHDLPEILEGIVDNKMRFSILSNGSLVEDDMAAFIAKTKRCDYIQISVDGSNPKTHDFCRGEGSFEGAIHAIRTLQLHGVPVAVRVTVNHHNVDDLENIARFLIEDLNVAGFGTNSAQMFGSCRLNSSEVQLTTQDRSKAMHTLLRLSHKYKGRISATAGPLANAKDWYSMGRAKEQGLGSFPRGGFLTSCGCSFSKIAVRSDGIIVPCNLLPHMELGRINKDHLDDIWLRSSLLNNLRKRSTISLSEFEFCQGCSYIPYCTGSCPASAYSIIGEVDHPSPEDCLRRFLTTGGDLPVSMETG